MDNEVYGNYKYFLDSIQRVNEGNQDITIKLYSLSLVSKPMDYSEIKRMTEIKKSTDLDTLIENEYLKILYKSRKKSEESLRYLIDSMTLKIDSVYF